MSDSVFTGSMVVVGEVSAGCVDDSVVPEGPAVPDPGGEGEDALTDARPDTVGDVAAVPLERELAFEGVVDRLDPLSDPAELSEPGFLIAAVWAQKGGVQASDGPLKLLAGEPFVADDDLPTVKQAARAGAIEHRERGLTLGIVGGRQAEADRHPVRGAQQVEPQPPEVARVRGAVPVGSPAGQLRTFASLARLPAWDRGRVQQPDPFAERRRGPGQVLDDQADLARERSQPLVVAGLQWDVREQMSELFARKAQEPPLGMTVEQDLRDRERDELGRGDPWAPACTASDGQEIIHQHEKCGEKVVEVGEHEATSVRGGLLEPRAPRGPR